MQGKKRSPKLSIRMIYNLLLVIPSIFNLISNITRVIKYDAYLAGKNIVIIIITAVMFSCLLTSTWFGILAILFMSLIKLQWSFISAAIILVLLNLFLLFVTAYIISKAKNKLSFPASHSLLRKVKEDD